MIYATYWICTVVTTVGYGDYYGSNTLEYVFSFFVMFFGFIIFAVLQIAVFRIVQIESSFGDFVTELDFQALNWYWTLEITNQMIAIQPDLFETIKSRIHISNRRDYSLVQEYGFFDQLSPKYQTQLTDQLWGHIKLDFGNFFDGCK